jgi:hypothetical protein
MGSGTIFYVHGAGNRHAQAEGYEAQLREGLGIAAGSPRLRRSDWGEQLGPKAAMPGLESILPEVIPAGAGFAAQPDLADPTAPLRALSGAGAAGFAAPKSDGDQLLALLQAGLVDLDDELGVRVDTLQAAATSVAESQDYANAAGSPSTVVEATLQSVSAAALAEQDGVAFGAGDVLSAVGGVASGVARQILGSGVASVVGSWGGTTLLPGLKLGLTKQLAQDRAAIMRKTALVPTDVLFYQRHGASIRDGIREEIAQLDGPVIALGHSLGGIILVDTLFEDGAPDTKVELLVTFGSQSAYLQCVQALDPLTPKGRWVNIWTPYDFVSFIAGGMWPGLVEDVKIPIDVGFPDAHGAYYQTPAFLDVLKAQAEIAAVLA